MGSRYPLLRDGDRQRPTGMDHDDLTGRDDPEQHPISSITGLTEALAAAGGEFAGVHNDLDGRATADAHPQSAITDLEADLAGKATPSDVSSAITDHAGASDPHGDRAHAAGLVDDLSGVTDAATARTNLGLGNVDNTSDANKPVSTAQQTALDGKAAASHSHSGADITSGTVSTARLGTGAANATTFLRGDGSWAAAGGSETLPASIIDAKGDLIVGTAADTAARLAVGADGQVLTADSGEASGVKWAAAGGGGQRARGSSAYWVGSSTAQGAMSASASQMDLHVGGNASCWPVWLASGGYNRIAVYVAVAGTATLRLGVSYCAADGGVGAPAWDAGTINVSSTGRIEIAASTTFVEGWYWTVVMCESYAAAFNLYARSWTQNDIRNGMILEPGSFRQYGSVRHGGVPTGSLPDLSSYPAHGSLYGPIVALRRT